MITLITVGEQIRMQQGHDLFVIHRDDAERLAEALKNMATGKPRIDLREKEEE